MVGPEGTKRISKIDTYLNVAEAFAYRSTCIKRKYGAVIVKDDVVISTGYNGSPRGYDNCCDLGVCPRIQLGMHQGEGYGICRAIHAELFPRTDHWRRPLPSRHQPRRQLYPPRQTLPSMLPPHHPGRNPKCLPPRRRQSRRVRSSPSQKSGVASVRQNYRREI